MATHLAKEKAKRMAENFLSKLVDSFDAQKEDAPSAPPKPPPKPPKPSTSNTSGYNYLEQDILPSFNDLAISGHMKPNHSASSVPFVGGFNPGYTAIPTVYAPIQSIGAPYHSSAPSLARPITMPTPYTDYPQSLTMQMALSPPEARPSTVRPHSNPEISTGSNPTTSSSSNPPRPSLNKPTSSPSTPTKANKSEISSAISSPSQKVGQEQCAGVTKAGKRCARMVKIRPGLIAFVSDDGDSTSIPRFCHQHSKELLGPSGYYARKNGEWVTFEDWIPPYLQSETQVSLRVEMEKARSQSDVHGYIYTFEIRETLESETIKLKVGRAVNLVKRIDQWGKQCGSKEQVLRGFFPGTVEPDEDGSDGSLMKGRVKAGEKGPWCHRLERLIHLELADLASTCMYLDPAWPKVDKTTSSSTATDNASKASASKELFNAPKACPDCGSIHKEIFEFQRWKRGRNKGKEWENVVKPVVERWGKFVELYV